MKVKEKLDEEMREIQKRRQDAIDAKQAVALSLEETMAKITAEREAAEAKRKADLAIEQAKQTHLRTISQHQLDLMEKM